jgi:hypothetical protein
LIAKFHVFHRITINGELIDNDENIVTLLMKTTGGKKRRSNKKNKKRKMRKTYKQKHFKARH